MRMFLDLMREAFFGTPRFRGDNLQFLRVWTQEWPISANVSRGEFSAA